jgi:phosphate-selective porin OprO/OprP
VGAEDAQDSSSEAEGAEKTGPVRNLLDQISPLRPVNLNPDFSITHGLRFTNEEAGFDLHLGGRVLLDAVNYFEDRNSGLSETVGVRDARLEAEATLGPDWSSRWSAGVTVDDTGSVVLSLKDLYVRYLGFAPFELTLGQQDEPFSLEEMTSARRTTFMERGLPNAFAPGNNFGLSVRTNGDWWAGSAGIFAGDLTSSVDQGDLGRGATGRFVVSPTTDASGTVHLGGSVSLRDTTRDDNISFFQRPEVGLADFQYVDTGRIQGADRVFRLGFEGAYVQGPYSVQGEFMNTWVERQAVFPTVSFNGLYVYGSWMVTGETRPYIREIGNFGPIVAKHEYGAVELAARYSRIDLTSRDITGGAEQNITLGVNWYVRPQVRLMANYVLVFADNQADDDGTLIGGDHPQMFQVRLQVSF